MTLKPVLHGRDHRPGGVDPIPGLPGPLPSAWQIWADEATISEGASANVTWADPGSNLPDSSGGLPFPFLDLTDVTAPLALTDGQYAITLNVYTFDLSATAGAYLQIEPVYAFGGSDFEPLISLPVGPSPNIAHGPPGVLIEKTWWIAAGDGFGAIIKNLTGTGKSFVVSWKTAVTKVT